MNELNFENPEPAKQRRLELRKIYNIYVVSMVSILKKIKNADPKSFRKEEELLEFIKSSKEMDDGKYDDEKIENFFKDRSNMRTNSKPHKTNQIYDELLKILIKRNNTNLSPINEEPDKEKMSQERGGELTTYQERLFFKPESQQLGSSPRAPIHPILLKNSPRALTISQRPPTNLIFQITNFQRTPIEQSSLPPPARFVRNPNGNQLALDRTLFL
jgi:hypothetical protein